METPQCGSSADIICLATYFPTLSKQNSWQMVEYLGSSNLDYLSFFHVTDLHLEKALFTIITGHLSITISRLKQFINAPLQILVTDDGISTLFNLLHPLNAPSPISVTDDGIFTLVKPLQPLNV